MIKKIIVTSITLFLLGYCTSDENHLLETTFKREFDKKIISEYLHSDEDNKINAALLSVSHSEDTSFIPVITQLDFNFNPVLICFAIGQIGECLQSVKYLRSEFQTDFGRQSSLYIFEAIGKCGTESDMLKLQEDYANYDGLIYPYEGVSLMLQQFAQRGIDIEQYKWILIDEVNNSLSSNQRKKNALFALARNGSSELINDELLKILKSNDDTDAISIKQFAFMNFKTQKYFPSTELVTLLNKYLNNKSILLRIEAAKTLCYASFDENLIQEYWKFISTDENPNVQMQAAISLREINNWNDTSAKAILKSLIEDELNASSLSTHTMGELIISYKTLFPTEIISEKKFQNMPNEYFYKYLAFSSENENFFNKLVEEYQSAENVKNKMNCLSNLSSFKENFSSHPKYSDVILDALNSNSPPLIALASVTIDSAFAFSTKAKIEQIIDQQIVKNYNNAEFSEAVIALFELAKLIDDELFIDLIKKYDNSSVYSIKKYIAENSTPEAKVEKDITFLKKISNFIFKYESAEIVTKKGSFTIQFKPEVAPVSVGNFCKLAEANFYDGIEFHRVVPGFVIQTGDPTSTGWGGPGYEIISEFSPITFETGIVGMASAGKDTESSQWFVMQGSYPHLNGRYSLFGEVKDGMDVIYKIERSDKITDVILNP